MMADPPVLLRIAFVAIGAALFYVAMCRLRHVSLSATLARVRYAVVAQLAAGVILLLAGTVRPDWTGIAAVAGPGAALWWSMATSHAWRSGQPASAAKRSRVKTVATGYVRPWHDTVPARKRDRSRA